MATTPVTPTNAIQSELSQLAHKHVTLTYGILGILFLVLALAGVGGYAAVKVYDAQLARQDARDATYQSDRKAWQDSLTQSESVRAGQAQEIAALQAQVAKRDSQPLPKPVQVAIQPTATVQEVVNGVKTAYNFSGGVAVSPDGQNVLLDPLAAQQTILAKVNGDRAQADLKDLSAIVDLQKQSMVTLNTDLNQCKVLNTKAQADIEGYKKLAHRTKFQKFLSGAEKVAIFVGGVYIGHKF